MSIVHKCSVKLVLERCKRSEQYLECSGSQKTAHFQWGIRPKEGDTETSAKEAGNKSISSAALPLRCLPTWDIMQYKYCDVPGSPCLSKKGESNVWFVSF